VPNAKNNILPEVCRKIHAFIDKETLRYIYVMFEILMVHGCVCICIYICVYIYICIYIHIYVYIYNIYMCYCKGKFGNSSRNMIITRVTSKNFSVSLLLFFFINDTSKYVSYIDVAHM
jgi:hypothetical protein